MQTKNSHQEFRVGKLIEAEFILFTESLIQSNHIHRAEAMTDQAMKAEVQRQPILLKFGFIVILIMLAMDWSLNLLIQPERVSIVWLAMPMKKMLC